MITLEKKPYLLHEDGSPMMDEGEGEPYVDCVVETSRKRLCWVCMMPLLPIPHMSGSAENHHPKVGGKCPRVWWFTKELTAEQDAAITDYFRDPRCTLERHAFYETNFLKAAVADHEKAERKLREIVERLPGWSIDFSEEGGLP